MRTVLILRGLPASGKSSFCRDLLSREPNRWIRLNRDDFRGMINNTDHYAYNKRTEELTTRVQEQALKEALNAGFDVVIDNTNLVPRFLQQTHDTLKQMGNVKVIEKCFSVSYEECVERNSKRTGRARVPADVMFKMANGLVMSNFQDRECYYPARPVFVAEQDEFDAAHQIKPRAIIVDVDGTFAIISGRNPYDVAQSESDLPNRPVIECIRAMRKQDRKLVFVTGREDKFRPQTRLFIERHMGNLVAGHGLHLGGKREVCVTDQLDTALPDYELFMRATGDKRRDSIVKFELYNEHIKDRYYVDFVLDDRNSVVDMWRRDAGLPTFQVAPGDF